MLLFNSTRLSLSTWFKCFLILSCEGNETDQYNFVQRRTFDVVATRIKWWPLQVGRERDVPEFYLMMDLFFGSCRIRAALGHQPFSISPTRSHNRSRPPIPPLCGLKRNDSQRSWAAMVPSIFSLPPPAAPERSEKKKGEEEKRLLLEAGKRGRGVIWSISMGGVAEERQQRSGRELH